MRTQQAKRLLAVVAYRQRWIKLMNWDLLIERLNAGTMNEKVRSWMLEFAQDGKGNGVMDLPDLQAMAKTL
jgi:hypothetical protein